MNEVSELIGRTISSIHKMNYECLEFSCTDGTRWYFDHNNVDCCNVVELIDGSEEFADLLGSPILVAEERHSDRDDKDFFGPPEGGFLDEASTWTFVVLRTNKASCTLRWYGTSNGWYSTVPAFRRMRD